MWTKGIEKMASLIDAEKLAEKYRDIDYRHPGEWKLNDILNFLEMAPTVDAVEVVRCKDCKHYVLHALACRNEHMNGVIAMDGFCSYGERQ